MAHGVRGRPRTVTGLRTAICARAPVPAVIPAPIFPAAPRPAGGG